MKFNLQDVANRYESPGRFYHRWAHITRMFADARLLQAQLNKSQVLAIVFHDIVYDPKSSINEESSAEMMLKMTTITDSDDTEILNNAWYLIQDTKDHCPILCPTYSPVVLDLDLMMLGDDFDKYLINVGLIRKEYAFASNDQWTKGRSDFIKTTLAKDVIFNTPIAIARCEKQARSNLERELKMLSA